MKRYDIGIQGNVVKFGGKCILLRLKTVFGAATNGKRIFTEVHIQASQAIVIDYIVSNLILESLKTLPFFTFIRFQC